MIIAVIPFLFDAARTSRHSISIAYNLVQRAIVTIGVFETGSAHRQRLATCTRQGTLAISLVNGTLLALAFSATHTRYRTGNIVAQK